MGNVIAFGNRKKIKTKWRESDVLLIAREWTLGDRFVPGRVRLSRPWIEEHTNLNPQADWFVGAIMRKDGDELVMWARAGEPKALMTEARREAENLIVLGKRRFPLSMNLVRILFLEKVPRHFGSRWFLGEDG